MSIRKLRTRATKLGLSIKAERDDYGWGYWIDGLEDNSTLLSGDRFCESHQEIDSKLTYLEGVINPQ